MMNEYNDSYDMYRKLLVNIRHIGETISKVYDYVSANRKTDEYWVKITLFLIFLNVKSLYFFLLSAILIAALVEYNPTFLSKIIPIRKHKKHKNNL